MQGQCVGVDLPRYWIKEPCLEERFGKALKDELDDQDLETNLMPKNNDGRAHLAQGKPQSIYIPGFNTVLLFSKRA
jgi:hypothetical protein